MPTDPVPPLGADGRSEPDPATPPAVMPGQPASDPARAGHAPPAPPGWHPPGWRPPGAEPGWEPPAAEPDQSDQATVRVVPGPPPQPPQVRQQPAQPPAQPPAGWQPPPFVPPATAVPPAFPGSPQYPTTPQQRPTYPQPTYPQATNPQPAYQQPTYPQPTYQQPTYQQPTYQQPTYQQPTQQQPPPPTYQPPGGQYPGYGQYGQYPGSPPPATSTAARSRSKAIWPLAAVVATLVLAVVGTSGYWLIQSGRTNSQISRLAADHQRHEQKQQDARTALKNAYAAADLPGKLKDLRAKNTAYTTYLRAWNAQASENARLDNLHVLQKMESDCLEAIIEYNRAAAGFSEQLRGEQPEQIDMKDHELNCEADYWTP